MTVEGVLGAGGPTFSAIISTLGQRELAPVLSSLAKQTRPLLEVIIVDQSNSDAVVRQLVAFEGVLPLVHVRQESKGLSRGRNAGIASARGDILIFPDDDCWYPDDFCSRVEQGFADGYDVITGRTLPYPGAASSRMGRFSDEQKEISIDNVLFCAIEFSMAVRARLAKSVRFDPQIGIGSGTAVGSDEGVDFLIRLLGSGARGLFSPHILAYHPDPVSDRRPFLHVRGRQYAQGRGYMLRRYPFPLRLVLREYIRPLGGIILSLVKGDIYLARYYLNVTIGKIQGYFIVLKPTGPC